MNASKKASTKEKIILTVVIVLVIGAWASVFSSSNEQSYSSKTESPPSKAEHTPDQIYLHIQAQGFVLQALKSPSTAKFPALPNEAISLGDGAYRVSSYVDSQNSFGAMIRTGWTVKMFLVEGHWFLDRMIVDGKVVYDASSGN